MSNTSLVIKKIDFEETSLILSIFDENGFSSLMVKGAKRKNSDKLALSEPLSLISYEKTKSKFPSLTEGVVKESYRGIKEDLFKYSIASIVLEYIYTLKETINEYKHLYNLTIMTLDELNLNNENPEDSLFRFEALLTRLLGIGLKKEYLSDKYMASTELLDNLDCLYRGETIKNREVIRDFFIEYYKNEMGLNLKSKKLYLSLIEV